MKKSLAAIALLAMCAAATAQVYIPDSAASGSRNVIPFGGAWPSSNTNGEFTYQWWIPQNLLGSTPFRIVGIANITSETGVHTATKGELTISHSSSARSTVFVQNMPSPVTLFTEGPWSWTVTTGQWSPMPMDTGAFFDYNGVDNLVLQVRLSGAQVSLQGATNLNCYNSPSGTGATRIYRYGTGAYNATSGSSPTLGYGGKLELTISSVSITGSGNPSIGGKIDLDLSSPADGALPYICASSLGNGPVQLGQRQLGLSLDNMFSASVSGVLPTIFQNYLGTLDAQGKARSAIAIPSLGLLVGVRIYSAFVTVKAGEPFNLKSISNTFDFTITT